MDIHFKIIELEDRQVLITKDFDEDDDSPLMFVTFFIQGDLKVNLKYTFVEEDVRNTAFENAGHEYARKQVDDILSKFN